MKLQLHVHYIGGTPFDFREGDGNWGQVKTKKSPPKFCFVFVFIFKLLK